MEIDTKRLHARLEQLARFGCNDRGGIDRSVGSRADREARAWLTEQWKQAGLTVRTDAIANLWARAPGPVGAPIVLGSHHDAVPDGGRFDGALGVLLATEVVQTLQESGIPMRHPLEVVSFTAEEPNPFGLSTLGSRAITGKLTAAQVGAACDENGRCLTDVIAELGGDVTALVSQKLRPGVKAAYLEPHIEQGRNLYDAGLAVASVDRITGIYREYITVEGEANHAGTTTMPRRHDALLAAGELALALETTVSEQNRCDVVGTVGKFNVFPNAANIIPGQVELILELRTPDRALRTEILEAFTARIAEIEAKRGIHFVRQVNLDQAEVILDPVVTTAIAKGCKTVQNQEVTLVSMAGHDAVHMSGICPAGMLFIQSVAGISHSRKELTHDPEIDAAAQALMQAVIELDRTLPITEEGVQ